MFNIRKKSLDDLIRGTFLKLLQQNGISEVSTSKGRSLEVFGAGLELTNPRCRLSRSMGRARVYSALGELFWYLSGSNSIEQIEYYIQGYSEFSDDGKTAAGAYGPRVFSPAEGHRLSPWEKVMERLSSKSSRETRNAVIPIATPQDFQIETKDRPCTCLLQFVVRNNRLNLQVYMRSNDAYLGMPHDIFSFTMLQEIAARQIGVGLGYYVHTVGSLHLYADPEKLDHRKQAQDYLDEGLFAPTAMPAMPDGDPWPDIRSVLIAEREIRLGNLDFKLEMDIPDYWADIITLLRVYGCGKHLVGEEKNRKIRRFLKEMNYSQLQLYVRDRLSPQLETGKDLFEAGNADVKTSR